jgi:hypothetical protein
VNGAVLVRVMVCRVMVCCVMACRVMVCRVMVLRVMVCRVMVCRVSKVAYNDGTVTEIKVKMSFNNTTNTDELHKGWIHTKGLHIYCRRKLKNRKREQNLFVVGRRQERQDKTRCHT